mgnify:CR=1 FL=1
MAELVFFRRGEEVLRFSLDAPRTLRTIVNVVGWLDGSEPTLAVLGNHRDAWVRGAHDAGSGTVALLRAETLHALHRDRDARAAIEVAVAADATLRERADAILTQ